LVACEVVGEKRTKGGGVNKADSGWNLIMNVTTHGWLLCNDEAVTDSGKNENRAFPQQKRFF